LVDKYKRLGLPESEMATALLARSALTHPEVPQSAMEKSARRIEELSKRSAGRGKSQKPSLGDRIKRKLGK